MEQNTQQTVSCWKFLRKLESDYLIETKQINLPHHVDCPDYIISKLTILQTLQWSETAVLCNFTWASSLASGRIKVETSTAWPPQPGCARPRQKSTNISLTLPPLYHNRTVFSGVIYAKVLYLQAQGLVWRGQGSLDHDLSDCASHCALAIWQLKLAASEIFYLSTTEFGS